MECLQKINNNKKTQCSKLSVFPLLLLCVSEKPSSSAWTFMTKYQKLAVLSSRHLLPTTLEAGESKIRVPTGLVPRESPLPGLHRATFLPCPHTASPWGAHSGRWGRDTDLPLPPPRKHQSPQEGPFLMAHLPLTACQRWCLPILTHRGSELQQMDLGGHEYSFSNTC